MAATTTAMPTSRGISIIIDQDQEQVVYNEPQQQLAKQEQLAAIKIHQKSTENQQQRYEEEAEEQQQQQQQPNNEYTQQMSTLLMNIKRTQIPATTTTKTTIETEHKETATAEKQVLNTFNTILPATTTATPLTAPAAQAAAGAATLIDIKCHNDANNNEHEHHEESVKKCGEFYEIIKLNLDAQQQQQSNETGNTSRIPTTTQLLLQIANETTTTAPSNANMENLERAAASPTGKLHSTQMLTINNGSLAAAAAKINGSTTTAIIPSPTTTIIKCFSDSQRPANIAAPEQEADMPKQRVQEEESKRNLKSMGAASAPTATTATELAVATINVNGEIGQFKAVDHDDDDDDDDVVVGKCVRTITKSERSSLENSNEAVAKELVSITTKSAPATFSASATTTVNGKHLTDTTHVVTIKIEPKQTSATNQHQNTNNNINNNQNNNNNNISNNNNSGNRQVTVVKLNDSANTPANLSASVESAKFEYIKNFINSNVVDSIQNDKMVQKTITTTANSAQQQQQNGNNNNTSVTDLNMSNHSPYHSLYYMMSSGQFSPCETLDSGTGSDLESNGNAASSPPITHTNGKGVAKLEMHLKTTKIRVNGATNGTNGIGSTGKNHEKMQRNGQLTAKLAEHLRACSLTDSEESETSSSLSCDSLHSTTDFTRQSSLSPTHTNSSITTANKNNIINTNGSTKSGVTQASTHKSLGAFLPDSLLRDIRDRKYASNEFLDQQSQRQSLESVSEHDYVQVAHAKPFFNETIETSSLSSHEKCSSLPNKTFILNHEDGTFIDTKLNSMPRKYEADQYYNFHVNEHANFRSFGNILHEHDAALHDVDDEDGHDSLGDYQHHHSYERQTRSLRDDDFAGYKDIRSVSNTSTIRSSKGTVRGVKNRVRNGIATFLQLQQPNVKNYKEKDIGKVVLYTTSMGIIRDTYAKCANVKQILRTLLVKFEERDVFMSVEYQQEIKERMNSNVIRVPQLFVEGQHIGDADTVERLNESGELRQLLKPYKSIATAYTCQTCGGYRLLPCPSCNGSKKSVHRNHFTAEFVALKCMNCDEVGLVKCHNC